METLLRPIYQEHASNPATLGIIILEKVKPNSPITDDFDVILLIMVSEAEQPWKVKHYEFDDKSAALHIVTKDLLREWIDTSGYRRAIEWVIYGRKIFDRNGFITELKEELRSFPTEKRDLRKIIEFGKLVKRYKEGKELFEIGEHKEAYRKMNYSLHYLARLTVIEEGFYPEVTVWSQVKQIDLETYKLYEEFIESHEPIEKRIQLMVIAIEFIINKRARVATKHLLDVMQSKKEPWSFAELKVHPLIAPYMLDVAAILSYLVEKNIIRTVREVTKGVGVYHRKYVVNER
ncbi:nucleotidyltransferase-like protein [Virgibacillus xinjiangensis]|uniref:Nucleotidyltransferase-like protein n=1 Tax=Virgibacillus xinjiangensis TaxID=393090 RepID=A0ABV7CS55_9BACI